MSGLVGSGAVHTVSDFASEAESESVNDCGDVASPASVVVSASDEIVGACYRKVDIRLHGKGNTKLPWRKAGHPRHL